MTPGIDQQSNSITLVKDMYWCDFTTARLPLLLKKLQVMLVPLPASSYAITTPIPAPANQNESFMGVQFSSVLVSTKQHQPVALLAGKHQEQKSHPASLLPSNSTIAVAAAR